ncbi:MAG: hypothetical protein ACK2UO_08270 [Caldilineaceae bacterium]
MNPSTAEPPTMTLPRHSEAVRWTLIIIVLIAFLLRAFHLDYQSLWSDEGISILRSSRSLVELWRSMPVEHVPGYFALLHLWMSVTGDADFALRYLSLLPSVFAVALMMRMGRDLGNARIGVIAGALFATSAFQVWYAQEVRMYSWLLGAGLFSTWCLWLLLTRSETWVTWLGYVAGTTASVYLHYFGFLVPMVQAVVVVIWLIVVRDGRSFLRWAAAGFVVLLLYLPWASRALGLLGFQGWRAPVDPNRIPWLLLRAYTAGETMPEAWSGWVAMVYLVLVALGVAVWFREGRDAGLFLSSTAGAAVLLTWLLVIRQPDFHVRYTIFVSAPLTLLAAAGVAGLGPGVWRSIPSDVGQPGGSTSRRLLDILPWLALAGLTALNAVALNRLYFDANVQKPDYRAAAARIEANLQEGDVVLVDGPNPKLVFEHYFKADVPILDLRMLEGKSDAEVDEALEKLLKNADRVWELLYFKPPGPVQVWLATRGWTSTPTFHNNIRVQLVGLDRTAQEQRSIEVKFGDALELLSSEFDPGPHSAGDLVRLSTNWYVHEQAPEYKFSLRLVDKSGNEAAAVDYVPQNWFAPTNVWFVGQPATDQHGLLLPDDLAPGIYHVTLRLYDPNTGVPVETALGVDVPIAEFVVE